MAKNTGEGSRRGSINDRTQTKAPGGNHVKRDTDTGSVSGTGRVASAGHAPAGALSPA